MTVQQRDITREEKQKKTLKIDINFSENKKKSPIYIFANINHIILKVNKNVERSVEEISMKQFNCPY